MLNHQSKIEKLITELCPNGVEFKELWELTAWDKKFNGVEREKQKKVIVYPYVLANRFKELTQPTGNVRLLSTGDYLGWTTEVLADKNLCEGEIVAIPWGGQANVKYYKGKFVTSDNRIATSLDTKVLLNKFLYYWMLVNNRLIESFYRGAGIKHPSMKKILNMKIPLPPFVVQEEIVAILDKFTEIEAELEAELEARKKQYKYYYKKLLVPENSLKQITLNEVGKVSMCKRIFKSETLASGEVPFYKIGTFGKKPNAFISQKIYDEYCKKFSFPKKGDVLLSASGTIGRRVIYNGEPAYFQDSNIIWIDNDESKVLNKYLYYLYATIEWKTEGGTIQRLYNDNLKKIKIQVPPIAEQERIVTVLDKFDSLVNDISVGLPAELTARRTQYEYYRNKLLTFNEYAQ